MPFVAFCQRLALRVVDLRAHCNSLLRYIRLLFSDNLCYSKPVFMPVSADELNYRLAELEDETTKTCDGTL